MTAALGSGEMFDRIADRYDLVNRVLSLGIDVRWRQKAVSALELSEGARVLDVATGTGNVALVLGRAGCQVVGIDPSERMLAIAREKSQKAGLESSIELELGSAEHLPYADQTFDGCVIAFGIRNVPDRARGLAEMCRVTRPGGRVVVLELGEPRGAAMGRLARFHVHSVVPFVGGLFSGSREYAYLQRSIAAFPPPEEFAEMIAGAGLEVERVTPLTFGVANLFVAQRPGAK